MFCTFLGDWAGSANQTRTTRIHQFVVALFNGDYMKLLAQYGFGTSGSLVRHVFISSTDHVLERADIEAVIQAAVVNNATLPPTNTSDIFLLVVDDSVGANRALETDHIVMCEPTNDDVFGFHFHFSTTAGNSFLYAVLPGLVDLCPIGSRPSDGVDSLDTSHNREHRQTHVRSRELATMVSDPGIHKNEGRTRSSVGWRLHLLGDWRLDLDGAPIRFLRRERQLLALLALQGPRPRGYIGGTLWPDVTDAKARASLRQAVSGIRHRLPEELLVGTESLSLAAEVQVDALVLRDWCARISSGSVRPTARKGLEALQALAGPELLLGEFDDWVLVERESIQRERLLALEVLASELGEPGEPGGMRYAIAACQAAADIEPLREAPARTLMALHLQMGNRVDALRTYESFCKRLHDELSADPSPQMTALLGL